MGKANSQVSTEVVFIDINAECVLSPHFTPVLV